MSQVCKTKIRRCDSPHKLSKELKREKYVKPKKPILKKLDAGAKSTSDRCIVDKAPPRRMDSRHKMQKELSKFNIKRSQTQKEVTKEHESPTKMSDFSSNKSNNEENESPTRRRRKSGVFNSPPKRDNAPSPNRFWSPKLESLKEAQTDEHGTSSDGRDENVLNKKSGFASPYKDVCRESVDTVNPLALKVGVFDSYVAEQEEKMATGR